MVMVVNAATAGLLVETAAVAIQANPDGFRDVLDDVVAPIYATDLAGTLTYFNPACVSFAGRTPLAGTDKWCVSWRIFTPEGEYMPHDQCPMAIAIHERRAVRRVEAVAERPDGSKVNFIPYPTPLFDVQGEMSGAVNLLLDVTEQRTPEYLGSQARRCRRLAGGIDDDITARTLRLMAARYDEQAGKLVRAS
jgi:PAS domain S-box-containing protein